MNKRKLSSNFPKVTWYYRRIEKQVSHLELNLSIQCPPPAPTAPGEILENRRQWVISKWNVILYWAQKLPGIHMSRI